MRGAMQGWKRARMAGPGAAVSALALAGVLALAALAPAPPALAAAPLPERLGECVDYKASGDGTVLFNRCNVDLTVRYCCTGPKAEQHWRCAGGRAARKGAHQWLPATAQGQPPQTHPMACDARAGWRRAACAVRDRAFGATLGPYNWNGGQPDPGMRCTDPQTAGAASAEAPAGDAAKKGGAPEATGKEATGKKAASGQGAAKKDTAKEARAAARPAPQEAAKPAAKPARKPALEPNLALQSPLWIQQWLARLGFDPGPLDGVAGARTQAALRLWQAARGYPATGVLTAEQALVLGGLKPAPNAASGTAPAGRTAPKAATPPADRTAARTAPKEDPKETPKTAEPPAPPAALTPKCSTSKDGGPYNNCWAEVPSRPGCHVWFATFPAIPREQVTGSCRGGVAHGRWSWLYFHTTRPHIGGYEGLFVNGKQQGRWVIRVFKKKALKDPPLWVVEYTLMDGKRHGRAVWRKKNGSRRVCQYSHGKKLGCQEYKR